MSTALTQPITFAIADDAIDELNARLDEIIAAQLDRFFERVSQSEYAETVDPGREYPRVSRDCE